MSGKIQLNIIWDFDGPIGQINASHAYNWSEDALSMEQENVDRVLSVCQDYEIAMTFAVTGLSAAGDFSVLHMGKQVRKIADLGHEVASHSWKHEWFPFLTQKQIRMSLKRSKEVLEKATGKPVGGFVLPFTRPMTWLGRGNFSLGDRGIWPFFFGGDQGNIYRLCDELGYSWVRVKERPIYEKILGVRKLHQPFEFGRIRCLPNHHNGFDEHATALLTAFSGKDCVITINAHPLMLSKEGNPECWDHFRRFIDCGLDLRDRGVLTFSTPSGFKNENESK